MFAIKIETETGIKFFKKRRLGMILLTDQIKCAHLFETKNDINKEWDRLNNKAFIKKHVINVTVVDPRVYKSITYYTLN